MRALAAARLALALAWLGALLLVSPAAAAAPQKKAEGAKRPPSTKAVNEAIDRGVKYLLEHGPRSSSGPGEDALQLYALLKGGLPRDHPAVARLTTSLALADLSGTYVLSCALLAIGALDGQEHRGWLEEMAAELIETQNPSGDWGYPAGADLSNTQYAALGLWAAANAGVEVERGVWDDLLKATLRYQGGDGGFGYRPGGKYNSTGSMTAAGLGILGIARTQLRLAKGLTPREQSSIDQRLARGLGWLNRHFSVTQNPGAGGWLHYYLYGLERVGGLLATDLIGEHDWYALGSRQLLKSQRESGRWGAGTVQTAFGILFLKRATARITGKGTRAGQGSSGARVADSTEAPFTLVAAGDTPLSMWIAGWRSERLEGLLWPEDGDQGPRVIKVEYLAGRQVLGSVAGSARVPAGEERYAHRHSFRAPGEYELRARVHVLGPRTKDAEGRTLAGQVRVLESSPLALQIQDVVPEWLVQQRLEAADYLLKPGKAKAEASSVFPGGRGLPSQPFPAEWAVDGTLRRPWLAASRDEQRTLILTLRSALTARTVLIFGARSTPHRVGFFARPLEVLVRINNGEPQRVPMHVDERRAGRLELPKAIRIRKLELTIPWSAPGEVVPVTGLAEVQLLRR